jgi:endonuclease/exonuclease/phosphatase family metal-dependent hydrolase
MSKVSCRAFAFFANAERAGVGRIDARLAGALTRIAAMFAAPRLLYRVAMLLAAGVGVSAGCAGATGPMLHAAATPSRAVCRAPIAPSGAASAHAMSWRVPFGQQDRATLDRWCSTTGPPVLAPDPPASSAIRAVAAPVDELVVVSWNLHVGTADLPGMVRRLRQGEFTSGAPVSRFVMLLQEAYRDAPAVPRQVPAGMAMPKAIGSGGSRHARTDVVRLAQSLGLALYYAPSMRNGSPAETTEDRGNAILSTEPLSDFQAIELPFERQRRVAIAATVSGHRPGGAPWTLRVASVHLDSTASARRLWLMASGARARQVRGLLDALRPLDGLVMGGDFNTWFGFSDSTYRLLSEAMPDVAAGDRRRTFMGLLRLDHVFSAPPPGWTVTAHRLDDRMGSDHYPMLARVRPVLGPMEREAQ